MKYRLYIDEVGNSDLGSSTDPNHRYLSLTGVILNLEYVAKTVFPAIEALKRDFFDSHPDEPVILHRKELIGKNHPFESLRDPTIEKAFNDTFLSLLHTLDYGVITIVIDKLEHIQRYEVWRFDPYHYCLTIMIERYALWLKRIDAVGDVMAEARNGKADTRLKETFERIYENGTEFISSEIFVAHLTSKKLKVKPKQANIAGLQLEDIIAHPSFRATLLRREFQPLPDKFGGKIGEILETSKYIRSPNRQIDRWGRKWLP